MTPLAAFAERVQTQQHARYARDYPAVTPPEIAVHVGPKYARVDVGGSGKYMVVNATGEIFGIKAYGVIHRGYPFGTLDTIHAWDWSGYRAVPLPACACTACATKKEEEPS